jgi:hypothetical protein
MGDSGRLALLQPLSRYLAELDPIDIERATLSGRSWVDVACLRAAS